MFMRRRPRYGLYLAAGAACASLAALVLRYDLARFAIPTGAPSSSAAKAVSAFPPAVAERTRSPAARTKTGEPTMVIDVARIGPDVSVFAGRAPPNSMVAILADGQVVATTKADETGEWATVIEREFAPGQHEFSLRAVVPEAPALAGERKIRLAIAESSSSSAPALPPVAAPARVVPTPITFVYNEASLTSGGEKAVATLGQYLTSHRWAEVVLSGHADERGSDRYNIELSRQRLEVVANYLRERGFVGRLELLPKGKSEPYAGIERQTLSREDAFQLDRRVELRVAR